MAYDETDKLEIPITKVQWGLRGAQVFFAFLSMCCIAAVIAFDNKFMSSSILSNMHLFFFVISMFFAAAIVGIPFIYLKYGKLKAAARALRVVRIEFVLTTIWCVILALISMGLSIELGFRNCEPQSAKFNNYTNGPNNSTFINGLPTTCRTERAGNAFGWFAVAAWLASLGLLAKEWHDNRRTPLPRNDGEVTMHTNSTRSSLEVPVTEDQYKSQYQEQAPAYDYSQPQPYEFQQMQHSGIPHQPPQGPPVGYPTGMSMPVPQQPSDGSAGHGYGGGANFPHPHHQPHHQ